MIANGFDYVNGGLDSHFIGLNRVGDYANLLQATIKKNAFNLGLKIRIYRFCLLVQKLSMLFVDLDNIANFEGQLDSFECSGHQSRFGLVGRKGNQVKLVRNRYIL